MRTSSVKQPSIGLDDACWIVFFGAGIEHPSQLEQGLANLLSPADLPDIDIAAARLADAVEQTKKFLSSVTSMPMVHSVALCVLALRAMGARTSTFWYPTDSITGTDCRQK